LISNYRANSPAKPVLFLNSLNSNQIFLPFFGDCVFGGRASWLEGTPLIDRYSFIRLVLPWLRSLMASPPIPPSLEFLNNRPFSFYPAIIGIEHNEWLFRKATWSEILVVNCKTADEIWISRRFLGEVSRTDDPVVIVGLNRELEYKAGTVWPYQRRVIEMPVAVGGFPSPPTPPPAPRSGPAPVVGIRLESNDRRVIKLIGGALAVGILLYVVAVNLNRIGEIRQRNIIFTPRDQSYLELTNRDDYLAVVQKLGKPSTDRWRVDSGEIQWRALSYPDRGWTVILMGSSRESAVYIGTVNDRWHVIGSVPLRSGGSTDSMLRNLKPF
jgi:hypothetical protein